jgi:hypothetical protein
MAVAVFFEFSGAREELAHDTASCYRAAFGCGRFLLLRPVSQAC